MLKAETQEPAYLVLLDRYDPDWNAYIDGQKAEILKANYLFRALYLEPGEHEIEFRYEPVWFYISIAVSTFVLLISVAGCIFIYYRERRKVQAIVNKIRRHLPWRATPGGKRAAAIQSG
ncbi:MAG: YfhO family protein [Actinomycetota bacterium]|nr:YfhO family protein [Actinomycetota bacterium]